MSADAQCKQTVQGRPGAQPRRAENVQVATNQFEGEKNSEMKCKLSATKRILSARKSGKLMRKPLFYQILTSGYAVSEEFEAVIFKLISDFYLTFTPSSVRNINILH